MVGVRASHDGGDRVSVQEVSLCQGPTSELESKAYLLMPMILQILRETYREVDSTRRLYRNSQRHSH